MLHRKLRAVVVAAALFVPAAVWAAAPGNVDDAISGPKPRPALITPLGFEPGKEVVVHDWVLCVSQTVAETMAKSRASGLEAALAAYAGLKASKSCGQFPELRLVLHESLYTSPADDRSRVFSAAVNIAGHWANAFVVEGSLPAEE